MKSSHLDHGTEPDAELLPARSAAKKSRPKRMWLWRAISVFLMSTVAFSAFFALYLRYAELPPSDIANLSKLLAQDETVLTDLVGGGENRLQVALKDIPQTVIDATISVEDQQFWNHGGFNPIGIARALWVDLKSGEALEGGSTITQQLAKNLYLTQDKTLKRKLQEAMHTLQLEMNFSKEEILEQYLNVIYYGQGAYGIEMASQTYFGKPSKDLTLAEASMLAGIPKGPNLYNPLIDLSAAKNRQRTVLNLMVQEGKVEQKEADLAFAEELTFAPQKAPKGRAPYFTDYVTYQLKQVYDVSEADFYRGGLKIRSTLDPQMQKAAEAAIDAHLKEHPDLQVSLISIDPTSGEIKAMVGGRNYAESSFNRTLAKRQPGSAFKPFVYLTALNNHYTAATRIKSEQTTFNYEDDNGDAKEYLVHNFNDQYFHDYLPFRDAIARSDNVFAVTTNMDVGPEKVITTAKALGITSPLKPYPSLALGVFPTSPLELVRAFAPFANGGQKIEPYAISSIEDTFRGEIKTFEPQKEQVIDPGAAFILTDMMRSVFTDPQGTGYRVHQSFDRPAAGKSGTTDTDAWMVGYTPQLLTAVWVGYDKDRLLSATESHLAAPIWADFMRVAHESMPEEDFQVPENVVESYIDPSTGEMATPDCPVQRREYFLVGTEPTEWCSTHPSAKTELESKAQGEEKSSVRTFWDWLTRRGNGE
ncbi:transglycosylase domain-containing protein [Tumebacillus lipolyticus]|uniref:Transglycosylase domain-containing protein n=1 Tax=Tumebacillus lipolyticus TaxID=1280370 RepID=A0ABW4ZY90_9BACL